MISVQREDSNSGAELTEKQRQIYEYIRDDYWERGVAPTIREIGARFGIASTQGVWKHLQALERKGFIVREEKRRRAIIVLEQKPYPLLKFAGHINAGPLVEPFETNEEFDLADWAWKTADCCGVAANTNEQRHILKGDLVLLKEGRIVGVVRFFEKPPALVAQCQRS